MPTAGGFRLSFARRFQPFIESLNMPRPLVAERLQSISRLNVTRLAVSQHHCAQYSSVRNELVFSLIESTMGINS